MALGAAAGGADALMAVIRQKLAQAAQQAQIGIAKRQQEISERRQQGQDAYQTESLGLQRRSADRADESARVLNDQRQTMLDSAAAQQETAGNQSRLRASIQGSQNLAGTDDPQGATATRNALRVALTSSGADEKEIPQEPAPAKIDKPKLHTVTVPGPNGQPMYKLVSEEEMQRGVVGYRAPEKSGHSGGADKGAAPGADGPSPYMKERNVRNLQSVDELMTQVGPWTTGAGSLLSNIPATEARNFKSQLDTLKANIGFGELTAMREASKTGGALGQVSNIELKLLSSALGGLDPGQSPAAFKGQLEKIRDSIRRWEAASGGAAPGAGSPSRETPEQRIKRLLGGG